MAVRLGTGRIRFGQLGSKGRGVLHRLCDCRYDLLEGTGGMFAARTGRREQNMPAIDNELLDILVCPLSHKPLVLIGDWLYSTDPETRRRYPIRDGIPIMLIDEAETISESDFRRVMAEAGQPV